MTESSNPPALEPKVLQALQDAKAHKKHALGKLISLFENQTERARGVRRGIIEHLQSAPEQFDPHATVLGFTGTPGAGKSTLIGELALQLLQQQKECSVAVLAVDPSSQVSGGALLGDRTRVHFPVGESRFFFRSQASNLELGGVSRNTFQAVRILKYFFDYIFIETVGIGQSEIEIQHLADYTFLVMQPLAGDQIQFMKSGIMEIPDSFIVNKCDEEVLAKQSYHLLRTSLRQAKILKDHEEAEQTPIFLVSALKRLGLERLLEHFDKLSASHASPQFHRQELFYLKKTIRERYGSLGEELLARSGFEWEPLQGIYEQKEAQVMAQTEQCLSRFFED